MRILNAVAGSTHACLDVCSTHTHLFGPPCPRIPVCYPASVMNNEQFMHDLTHGCPVAVAVSVHAIHVYDGRKASPIHPCMHATPTLTPAPIGGLTDILIEPHCRTFFYLVFCWFTSWFSSVDEAPTVVGPCLVLQWSELQTL